MAAVLYCPFQPINRPMRSVPFTYVIVACAMGFAGGIAGLHLASLPPQRPASTHPEPLPVHRSPSELSDAPPHDWLATLDTLEWGDARGQAWLDALQVALRDDGQLRSAVVQRYLAAATPELKSGLQLALVGRPAADLPQTAVALAQDANPGTRVDGWGLLTELPPTLPAYNLARQTLLSSEQDPGVLAGALQTLRHPVLPPPQDRHVIMPRLLPLTRSDAPMVRAHSVQLLADWDLRGRLAQPVVLQALADSHAVVRQAAVGAVMIGSLRSAELKRALFAILLRDEEDPRIRATALQALERFDLDAADYRTYLAARAELERRFSSGTTER